MTSSSRSQGHSGGEQLGSSRSSEGSVQQENGGGRNPVELLATIGTMEQCFDK